MLGSAEQNRNQKKKLVRNEEGFETRFITERANNQFQKMPPLVANKLMEIVHKPEFQNLLNHFFNIDILQTKSKDWTKRDFQILFEEVEHQLDLLGLAMPYGADADGHGNLNTAITVLWEYLWVANDVKPHLPKIAEIENMVYSTPYIFNKATADIDQHEWDNENLRVRFLVTGYWTSSLTQERGKLLAKKILLDQQYEELYNSSLDWVKKKYDNLVETDPRWKFRPKAELMKAEAKHYSKLIPIAEEKALLDSQYAVIDNALQSFKIRYEQFGLLLFLELKDKSEIKELVKDLAVADFRKDIPPVLQQDDTGQISIADF